MKPSAQKNIPCSLFFHFKSYNDVAGNAEGDRCLKTIANLLSNFFMREGDYCARYGGEEFAAICYGSNSEDMMKLGKKICEAINNKAIAHPGLEKDNVVTVSIGVAADVIEGSIKPEDLLKKADAALYQAKENGRNQVVEYVPD